MRIDLMRTEEAARAYARDHLLVAEAESPRIAVEGLIFDECDRLLTLVRGPGVQDERLKLEGIGGSLKDHELIQEGLLREIREEIGSGLGVSIDRIMRVAVVRFYTPGLEKEVPWIVVSHLCRLQSGQPLNKEETYKHVALRRLTLIDLQRWNIEPKFEQIEPLGNDSCRFTTSFTPGLSRSFVEGRGIYQKIYGDEPYWRKSPDPDPDGQWALELSKQKKK